MTKFKYDKSMKVERSACNQAMSLTFVNNYEAVSVIG